MEEFVLGVEELQSWIYLILGLAGLVYALLVLRAYRDLRSSVFSLERERATRRITRSGAMLVLIAAGLGVTFVISTFASPAIPASARPTPLPTVSLLASPQPGPGVVEQSFATATPIAASAIDGVGCENQLATIRSPEMNSTVRGEIEFRGTADIPNFAFYKLEYHDLRPESTWLAIWASNAPVCESGCSEDGDLLGTWDTTLVNPGQYAVQLVVTDTQGNAPMPCQILLLVVP
ncbi:MAG: hypothetical protein P8X64_13970 [Anaerolineales bacterium]|jgi:hypothetical protein